jgi:CRISPR/Cas system-associated exonuclease Cas4 (RecB family)
MACVAQPMPGCHCLVGVMVMNDFATQVRLLVSDPRRVAHLLALEKRCRGVSGDQLLFVGVSNVATVGWCALKAVLKSCAEEPMFCAAYLHDRLLYAHLLGHLDEVPQTDQGLLEAGAEVQFADVERLLHLLPARPAPAAWACQEVQGPTGVVGWVINPSLPREQQTLWVRRAAAAGRHVLDLRDHPKLRGMVLEETLAERYPTIRWHFSWGPYVVVGVPDGITDGFIYEFKTSRSRFTGSHLLPVATAQADLYCYFFRRAVKRVQLHVVEEGATDTHSMPADRGGAEAALAEFKQVDSGARPRPPRERWKCRRCEFRSVCPICPLGPS